MRVLLTSVVMAMVGVSDAQWWASSNASPQPAGRPARGNNGNNGNNGINGNNANNGNRRGQARKPQNCKLTNNLVRYNGDVSITADGTECMVWSAKDPHRAKYLKRAKHNKCRNPDRDPNGPWCYTTDPNVRYAYCDVGTPDNPICNNDELLGGGNTPTPAAATPTPGVASPTLAAAAPTPTEDNACVPQYSRRPSRIVGGTDAKEREFPFIVSLQTRSGNHYCGGSLIAPNWVLTAAHCGKGKFVSIGRHTQNRGDDCVERIKVKRTVKHPNYQASTVNNDIALFELETSSSFPPITPIHGGLDLSLFEAEGVVQTVAGWGTTSEGGNLANTLQKVEVPMRDTADCNNKYGGGITDKMICAGPESGGGKDSCQGDSGGPLFSWQNGQFYQTGVVSWGQGCARPNYYGVYTKLSEFDDWICSVSGVCN